MNSNKSKLVTFTVRMLFVVAILGLYQPPASATLNGTQFNELSLCYLGSAAKEFYCELSDYNGDGYVSALDLGLLRSNNPNVTASSLAFRQLRACYLQPVHVIQCSAYDADGDGIVGPIDFSILKHSGE